MLICNLAIITFAENTFSGCRVRDFEGVVISWIFKVDWKDGVGEGLETG